MSMRRYPSGQRGQTVNLLASPSEVRILSGAQKCKQERLALQASLSCLASKLLCSRAFL